VVTTSAEGFRTTTVSYADLDLNNAEARKTLNFRISRAAEKVCGSVSRRSVGSLAQASKNRSCYNSAMDEAMRNLSDGQISVVSR
jgi:UrcA family protein